jgi:hypothetical protein
MNTRTQESELFAVAISMMTRAEKVNVSEIRSVQDAMLNLRVDWEELQSRLRNRKIDGFEPAVDAIIQLAATSLAMAASLNAKIINQRLRQLESENTGEIDAANEFCAPKTEKQRKRKPVLAE